MIVYADSSFLISSYTADAHSTEADIRRALLPTLLITPFVRAEICTALHQQVFQKRISLAQANRAWQDFEQDVNNGTLTRIDFPVAALNLTVDLAKRFAPKPRRPHPRLAPRSMRPGAQSPAILDLR